MDRMDEKDVQMSLPWMGMSVRRARRILILGCPGSGKSTVAKQLASLTRLPRISLDDLYWGKGWARPTDTVFRAHLMQTLVKPCWILEGNYLHLYLEERIDAADTIIYLDVPTTVALIGVLNRSLRRLAGDRSTLPARVAEDPRYRPRWELRPHLLWLVLAYRKRMRPGLMARLAGLRDPKQVLILRSRREVHALTGQLV